MQTRVQKWGNSLAVRIPRNVAVEAGVSQDSLVEIWVEDEKIICKPLSPTRPNLAELLSQITPENIHGEIDSGPSIGREAW